MLLSISSLQMIHTMSPARPLSDHEKEMINASMMPGMVHVDLAAEAEKDTGDRLTSHEMTLIAIREAIEQYEDNSINLNNQQILHQKQSEKVEHIRNTLNHEESILASNTQLVYALNSKVKSSFDHIKIMLEDTLRKMLIDDIEKAKAKNNNTNPNAAFIKLAIEKGVNEMRNIFGEDLEKAQLILTDLGQVTTK